MSLHLPPGQIDRLGNILPAAVADSGKVVPLVLTGRCFSQLSKEVSIL